MNTSYVSSRSGILGFLSATYQLFAASILAAAAGTYVGLDIVHVLVGWTQWLLFGSILFMVFFVLPKVMYTKGWNLFALFLFTFMTGLMIAPLMASILSMPNGTSIVGQSFVLTSAAFAGVSLFAMTTKKDFSRMGGFLFAALIILIVASLINLFFHSAIFHLILAGAGALLFSAFILYDTQQIIKGEYDSPIAAAISLYLDFFNLFVNILQILGIMNISDD